MSKRILEMAAGLVQAQALKGPMSTEEIIASLTNVFGALMSIKQSESDGRSSYDEAMVQTVAERGNRPPGIDPKDSIQDDKVICLECGASMLQLTHKHLGPHGLTLQEYKRKWGFPAKQPLSSKNVSKARSRMAKKRGLPENLIKAREAMRLEREKAQSKSIQPSPVEPSPKEKKRARRKK